MQKRKGIIPSLTAHTFKREEIEKLAKAGAEIAILGKGASAKAHPSAEAQDYAREAGLELVAIPPAEAAEKLNQLME